MGSFKHPGPGWTATGAGVTRKYTHVSGWVVTHCGHPTARWPWAVLDPSGIMHTSGENCHLGMAFHKIDLAIAHVQAHLASPNRKDGGLLTNVEARR